jgi:hypothetical protein
LTKACTVRREGVVMSRDAERHSIHATLQPSMNDYNNHAFAL